MFGSYTSTSTEKKVSISCLKAKLMSAMVKPVHSTHRFALIQCSSAFCKLARVSDILLAATVT